MSFSEPNIPALIEEIEELIESIEESGSQTG